MDLINYLLNPKKHAKIKTIFLEIFGILKKMLSYAVVIFIFIIYANMFFRYLAICNQEIKKKTLNR